VRRVHTLPLKISFFRARDKLSQVHQKKERRAHSVETIAIWSRRREPQKLRKNGGAHKNPTTYIVENESGLIT
jgi:hypothetical protein